MRHETDVITTYVEQRFDGQRTYTLLSGTIEVKGKEYLARKYECRIPLSRLSMESSRVWGYSRFRGSALVLAASSLLVWVLVVNGLGWPATSLTACLCLSALVTGTMLVLATLRPIEFCRYIREDGSLPLDIARSGPDAGRFEFFLAQLNTEIVIAHRLARGDDLSLWPRHTTDRIRKTDLPVVLP